MSPVYEIVAYLLLSAGFLGGAVLCVRALPFYRQLMPMRAASHYPALDGLRGFLALGVFFHHSVIAYYKEVTGVWDVPPSAFFTLMGQAPVVLFFMLTGFLFWRKALQGSRFRPRVFYVERFRRLAPAYFFSLALIGVVVALPLGPESLYTLGFKEIKRAILFYGLPSLHSLFSAYWTLPWEWKYYLLLPLLALAAHRRTAWVIGLGMLLYVAFKPKEFFLINFVVGAAVAELAHRYPDMLRSIRACADRIAALSLVVLFIGFSSGYDYLPSVLLGIFFFCMVAGGTFWGLFTLRPALLLGTISYSVYLLHCIVIYVCIALMNRYLPVASLSFGQYFGLVAVQGVAVIVLSLFSYRWVEHPCMTVKTKLRA